MHKLLAVLALSLLLSACETGETSSGGVVISDPDDGTTDPSTPVIDQVVTGNYSGTFRNTPGTQGGNVRITLIESASGSVSGNIIFEVTGSNCLSNAQISGTAIGSSISLLAQISSTAGFGTLAMELLLNAERNQLTGTYVTSGESCSNSTGSGSMTLNLL